MVSEETSCSKAWFQQKMWNLHESVPKYILRSEKAAREESNALLRSQHHSELLFWTLAFDSNNCDDDLSEA